MSERPSKVPRFGDGELAGKKRNYNFQRYSNVNLYLLPQARHLLGVRGCHRNVGGSNQIGECLLITFCTHAAHTRCTHTLHTHTLHTQTLHTHTCCTHTCCNTHTHARKHIATVVSRKYAHPRKYDYPRKYAHPPFSQQAVAKGH